MRHFVTDWHQFPKQAPEWLTIFITCLNLKGYPMSHALLKPPPCQSYPFWDSKASKLSSVASEAFLAELAHGRQGSGHHAQKLHVAGHHAQQSADLQPRNGTLLGIMPSKVSVPGRTRTLLGIMPSNAWGLQTECSLLLGMMPSNAPGFGWQHVTGHHAQQWTPVFFVLVWNNALL